MIKKINAIVTGGSSGLGEATVREIFGSGTFFGMQVMPDSYQVNNFLLLPPSSFIIIGIMI